MTRTRFAPSPTGSLHVGGARTALYCLLHARHEDGTFVLRIEDTDQARSTDEATLGLQRDLHWLGLDWDEGPGAAQKVDRGPYFQSQRLHLYDKYVQQLLDEGFAYESWETREELAALRAVAEANKDGFRYRRQPYSDADVARFRAEGREPVVRLATPEHDYTIADDILGEVVVPYADVDDFVIRKADGFPTYHFAVVVDDHLMEVSMVLRGQEHLMNTAKHMALYECFGWEVPRHGHLPVIFNPQGGKMSKRDKARVAREVARQARDARGHTDWKWLAHDAGLDLADLDEFMKKKNDAVSVADAVAHALHADLPMIEVMDFRKAGFLPEALCNYLALLGWSPGNDLELMSMDEMWGHFTLDRVNKTAARFDGDKLRWMNGEYMKSLPIERLQELMALWLEVADSPLADITAPERREFLELYRQRAATFVDLDQQARFFFERPTAWDEKSASKHLLKGGGLERLADLAEVLADAEWTVEGIGAALEAYSTANEVGMGKVAQPLRIAVSGGPVSPGINETLALIARDEVLTRIADCVDYFSAPE